MSSKKLLVCGALVITLLLLLLQKDYASSSVNNFVTYTSSIIHHTTQIHLSNDDAINNAVYEELTELRKLGVDVDSVEMPQWKPIATAVTLQKKPDDSSRGQDGEEAELELQITTESAIAKTDHSAEKTTNASVNPAIFRVRNPDPEDLRKLTEEGLAFEKVTDPLPNSPYCKAGVFLTVLVISEPKSVVRRKYIRDSWAHAYEDDYRKLKGKQPFPGGKTYLPKNVVRVVFVMGQSKDEDSNVMQLAHEEARLNKDIVFGSVLEDYRNLTLKTKLGLKWAYYECKTSYVLKTDDDVFVNPVVLVEWLKEIPKEKLYTGWCNFGSPVVRNKKNKWYVSREDYAENKFPGYCLGGGYLMSVDLLASVVKMSYGRKIFPMEDLYVGLMLKDIDGVEPRDERRHFNLVYGGKTKDDCDFSSLFLLHRVLGVKLVSHMKQARNALENCS